MHSVYVASGWFSPEWNEELTNLKDLLIKHGFSPFVPRDYFCCPPDADSSVQQKTYEGNIQHLLESDWVLANTRNKDMGTIFECGFFKGVTYRGRYRPIVYFCAGLPNGGQFNLMLSQSSCKVVTSLEELDDYLQRCVKAGKILHEDYKGTIE